MAVRPSITKVTWARVQTNTPTTCTGTLRSHDARSKGKRRASHRMPGVISAQLYQ